jgi:hypothetical protein
MGVPFEITLVNNEYSLKVMILLKAPLLHECGEGAGG